MLQIKRVVNNFVFNKMLLNIKVIDKYIYYFDKHTCFEYKEFNVKNQSLIIKQYAVKVLEHTHTFYYIINIKIVYFVIFNKKISTLQK